MPVQVTATYVMSAGDDVKVRRLRERIGSAVLDPSVVDVWAGAAGAQTLNELLQSAFNEGVEYGLNAPPEPENF
jgi:hypothetical protein